MTKRQFDATTKLNWRGRMASDERCNYREERFLPHNGSGAHNPQPCGWSDDYVTRRAAHIATLRRLDGDRMPTLDRGSPYRAPQEYRAAKGEPLLGGRCRNPISVRTEAMYEREA